MTTINQGWAEGTRTSDGMGKAEDWNTHSNFPGTRVPFSAKQHTRDNMTNAKAEPKHGKNNNKNKMKKKITTPPTTCG